jgi:hypothetical protein
VNMHTSIKQSLYKPVAYAVAAACKYPRHPKEIFSFHAHST